MKEGYAPYRQLYEEIERKLKGYEQFDIEALLTVLQDIVRVSEVPRKVFNHPSVHYFSLWHYDFPTMVKYFSEAADRNRGYAESLLQAVRAFLINACTIKTPSAFDVYDEFFQQVMSTDNYNFRMGLQGPQPHPIWCAIFTTNYDQVLEAYCRRGSIASDIGQRQNEELDITTKNSPLYGDKQCFHIYKLHGSINWYIDQDERMRWSTDPLQLGHTTAIGDKVTREVLIYPVKEKNTFREPFYDMFHYLKRNLREKERCYVVGYSFRDDDLLGLFTDAMQLNERLRLILIDPNASQIADEKFPQFSGRVARVNAEFSIEAAKSAKEG